MNSLDYNQALDLSGTIISTFHKRQNHYCSRIELEENLDDFQLFHKTPNDTGLLQKKLNARTELIENRFTRDKFIATNFALPTRDEATTQNWCIVYIAGFG
ncbi:hypothetical protein PVAND_000132 [Polypedilum vanderplanki]|uniref:Uncharacterized protein n=1 Tax=Polypedilum vanderplanki TaxID=319348 RepID=A0A9J6BIW9_POLVA|nr:hypothetical protein PVAND_000132 [Polypedilum vanderplanki]